MTVYEDLLEWATSRPWWHQQALVRLAGGHDFTEEDYEALADFLSTAAPPEPDGGWLAGMQQPVDASAPPVRLTSIREVSNVNRLVSQQELTFAATGVTVVYGNNASGKSGYARLIKHLVRTRHREDVLPDIFASSGGAQAACLHFQVGDEAQTAQLSAEPPSLLSQVAYYDERCGDLYMTTEGEATYRPSALRLLDDLIGVCDEVRKVLDRRLTQNAQQRRALPDLTPDTSASAFLEGLSGTTQDADLEAACAAPEDAETRITSARDEEVRLRATDPAKEANRLEQQARAYAAVADHLIELDQRLGSVEETTLREKTRLAAETRAAADAASTTRFDQEPLEGVGSAAWRALWNAAQRFSQSDAYPDEAFPVGRSDAHCVLCQQPLDGAAQDRLSRFHRFMIDDTEEQAEEAAHELTIERAVITSTQVDTPSVAVALSTIAGDDSDLHSQVENVLEAWRVRQAGLSADPLREAGAAPDSTTLETVQRRSQVLREEAGDIDADRFTQRLAELVAEQQETAARLSLHAAAADVRAERDRRREESALQTARRQTDTRGISRASGELTSKHVTILVQDRFSRESQDLRVESVTLLGQGVRHGAVLHKPGFVGAVLRADLPQVLSEGEQTALGLAGFFVEAHLDVTKSALVLDDPVTSLDHLRRERVARRLVQFAAHRQVIVFTHDVVFAGDLKRIAGEEGVNFTPRSIERRGPTQTPGYCRVDHPWSAQDAQARLGTLKQDLVRLRKEQAQWDGDTYEREVGAWAGRLSETWERFVSQDLAGALFDRGTQEVRPMMLKVIEQFTAHDNKEYQEAYKRISRWATRHDKDASLNYVAPSVDDLEAELEVAQTWYERVRRYKSQKN